ncbi:MAG: DsbA family protein [Rhizobiales bacterium]|nr:DsbA family protein [Hyphomicrobiales bacterium]MDQ3561026.1 DsbA family protein [Pseudomonadota bacterium]
MPKLRAACAILAAFLLAAPAAAELNPEQKGEIEAVIRDYLIANPEVIEEAINALRAKREAETVASQTKMIEERQHLIFDSEHQMVLGNPAGAITLVEFFDYNCGYCKRAVPDMNALMEANPDLRIVMKEFPILSEGSVQAARVSVAVKDLSPERFLEFHSELFSRPGQADGGKALEIARDLGLDTEALQAAVNRDDVTRNLQEVQQLAQTLGISGTPSYVIGRELVPGAAGFDALQAKVAAMRECGKATC